MAMSLDHATFLGVTFHSSYYKSSNERITVGYQIIIR